MRKVSLFGRRVDVAHLDERGAEREPVGVRLLQRRLELLRNLGKGGNIMAEPVDVILAFHNAFRNDLKNIDAAALDMARGKAGLAGTVERYRFYNEVLVWHAHGEEAAIFPRIEEVAPLVAEAYLMDHRGLDTAFDALDEAYSARDRLKTARAT